MIIFYISGTKYAMINRKKLSRGHAPGRVKNIRNRDASMKNGWTTVTIGNKICHIYRSGSDEKNENNKSLPVFYWGAGGDAGDSAKAVVAYLRQRMPDACFLLAVYESENWNDDFSPWKAAAVFGDEGFGGKAGDTLKWLTGQCIPCVESEESAAARFLVGYSLAGLFSLWGYCESELFAGAVSCSGSLWYEGWLDYVRERAAVRRDGTNYIYLSLGDREERTKNRLMAAVGDNTRAVYAALCENRENVRGILEWNQGGHFSETDVRVAKGICWILQYCPIS